MKNSKLSIYNLTVIGLMTAVVFVASQLSIPLPAVVGLTRIHLGNVFCLLSGLLFGPLTGGFAAGLGSMFYDLTNPAFISEAPITFAFKFAMAYLCGAIAYSGSKGVSDYMPTLKRCIAAAIAGAVLYMALYLGKSFVMSYYLLRNPLETTLADVTAKLYSSSVNAILAVVFSNMLYFPFREALKRSNIYRRLSM